MKNFSIKTNLMGHQSAAVEKVIPPRVGGLFMDMGTGKSRTAIEMVLRRTSKIDKVIWFCPVALKETILEEILKHTDCTDIYVFDEKTNETNVAEARWYIIGIESMSSSTRTIMTVRKLITSDTFVILDESSYIKGHKALRTERITLLSKNTRYRLILTGTPLSQGAVDLYAQMRFLSPKILGYNSFYSFAANHLEYSDLYPGMIVRSHNLEYLAAKIQPYVYQVTKKECLDLPEKLYESRYYSMTEEQTEWYERAKEEILYSVEHDDFDAVTIFKLFTALQEIVSGFWNRNGETKEFESNRINVLLDVIEQIPDEEKIIIFAKYQYDIDEIFNALSHRHGADAVSVFTGRVREKKRYIEVGKFRQHARFFISTQSCGGHGLTLNEASKVIFYNNTFKYAERLQAEDRCHRIGQHRIVTYIDIFCRNSIDIRIEKALNKKGDVVEQFKEEVGRVKNQKSYIQELIRAL